MAAAAGVGEVDEVAGQQQGARRPGPSSARAEPFFRNPVLGDLWPAGAATGLSFPAVRWGLREESGFTFRRPHPHQGKAHPRLISLVA